MSNKAEQTLENRLIDRIAALERQLRELTTPQTIGGDIFALSRSPILPTQSLVAGPVTLVPNQSVVFYCDFYSDVPVLWNFLVTATYDVNDAAHALNLGSAVLTASFLR